MVYLRLYSLDGVEQAVPTQAAYTAVKAVTNSIAY